MYIASVRQDAQDISASAANTETPGKFAPARAATGTGSWRNVTARRPLIITRNDAPLRQWSLPADYKDLGAARHAADDAEELVIGDVPADPRVRRPSSTVVKTPHSKLHLPLQFLPILFRQARLFEHAMSVLETLNPAFAAQRRQLLCHCGEGFADPDEAATAIAAEDKVVAPQEAADAAPVRIEPPVAPVRSDPRERRTIFAPLNVLRRRSSWIQASGLVAA